MRNATVKNTISKADWLSSQQCLAMAWFGLRAAPKRPTEAELFRMEQGQEIGSRARELHPEGILVSKQSGKTLLEITQHLLALPSLDTLFEATFRAGRFVAKADILKRQDGAWHVLEVKSSLSTTSQITQIVDDLAYTVMVLRRVGLQIVKASLVLLSPNYRFGDSLSGLFEVIDATGEAHTRAADFDVLADSVAETLFADSPPPKMLISACRSCVFFSDSCLGSGVTHTILEIPGLHHSKLKRLSGAGIVDLSRVPQNIKLNARQERVKLAASSGNMVVEPHLTLSLASIDWPCYYLDFETVATALPLYSGRGCHHQLLTQFSIHHRDSFDSPLEHTDYLADASKDCERELAETLVERLGNYGSIIVYSSFEQTQIKALRDAFPDLANALQAIIYRLKNLLPVIEEHVYHPEFKGSFSIKTVLPLLVPDLSYKTLDVADGDTAITRFARMARGEISAHDVNATRQQLLDYCKTDTLAMVRLHDALSQLAVGRMRAGGA